MFRNRMAMLVSAAATVALLLTACGGIDTDASAPAKSATAGANNSTDQSGLQSLNLLRGTAKTNNAQPMTGDWANKPGEPTVTPVAKKWVQLTASRAGNLSPVVVNGAGFTLYRFDKDAASPSKSNCNGDCAVTWPPVVVAPGGKIFINGLTKSDVGVVKRDDGNLQVTIGGWPVYRFSKGLKPGDTNGQGVGGTWFGVTPDGQKADQPAGDDTADDTGGDQNADGKSERAVLFDDVNFADNGAQGLSGAGCRNVAPR
ncbi:hypothetical protein [Streptomyces sp. NPDC020681]|uniref:hypothetical protein n=1 Tax=Streptomyces sp. NPDC020681 TaxID=3365083 RepID=UPI0037948006